MGKVLKDKILKEKVKKEKEEKRMFVKSRTLMVFLKIFNYQQAEKVYQKKLIIAETGLIDDHKERINNLKISNKVIERTQAVNKGREINELNEEELRKYNEELSASPVSNISKEHLPSIQRSITPEPKSLTIKY